MSLSVNLFLPRSNVFADGGNLLSLHRNVGLKTGTAGSVDYRSVPYHQVMSHNCKPPS
jgi:hypothetical protein